MATENEKLCMAIITNSNVANIDWNAVAGELGIKVGAARQRWTRFKKAKFGSSPQPTNAATASATGTTPTKGEKVAGKKRAKKDMTAGAEDEVHQSRGRKAKKVKIEADEGGEEDAVSPKEEDDIYDDASDGSANNA